MYMCLYIYNIFPYSNCETEEKMLVEGRKMVSAKVMNIGNLLVNWKKWNNAAWVLPHFLPCAHKYLTLLFINEEKSSVPNKHYLILQNCMTIFPLRKKKLILYIKAQLVWGEIKAFSSSCPLLLHQLCGITQEIDNVRGEPMRKREAPNT